MKYKGQFSKNGYESLLKSFINIGYKFVNYKNIHPQKKHLIIRHDVDFLPEDTINISGIEKSLKVKAYYFFLVKSDIYNILSNNCQKVLSNLIKAGHNIGLHFDHKGYTDSSAANKEALNQCKLLQSVLKRKIEIISFHRPSKGLLNNNKKLAGRLHTYMPKFYSKISYCSDSGGLWKYGNPLESSAVKKGTAIQLLTHAEWWQSKKNSNRKTRIKKLFDKLELNNSNYFKNNFTDFKKIKSKDTK